MSNKKFMLKLPSEPSSIAMLEVYVERLVHKYKIRPDLYGNILVSLTEAVNNAIAHGNAYDRNKWVRVHVDKQGNNIIFKVSDEGGGFDLRRVPDPTRPENIHACGGRGVFLMRELCDDIEFHNNGSTVEMQFCI